MASFNKEYIKVIKAEGGYVNDPDDAGSETYLGISRKSNPNWKGWTIIDFTKSQYGTKNITSVLKKNTNLDKLVKELYKTNYWDVLELDDIPNQEVAHQLFDTCVNMGKSQAIKIAQTVLNKTVDGKWSKTLKSELMKINA